MKFDHLHTIVADLKRQGSTIWNQEMTINVKIDQSAIVVKKNGANLRFFGRGGREEITTIKRAGADMYESAINHISNQNWQQLPDGIEVFLENFNQNLNTIIRYDTVPVNNLIISFCNLNGVVMFPDEPLNHTVAEILHVSPPPTLFHGRLSVAQQDKIKHFLILPPDVREQFCGGSRFVDFVQRIFPHPDNLSWLLTAKTTAGDPGYEGLAVYINKQNPILAKIIDPLFTEEIIEKKQNPSEFNTILHLNVYPMLGLYFDEVVEYFESDSVGEARYIEFIAKLVQLIVDQKDLQLHPIFDFYKNNVTNNRFARITHSLIPSDIPPLVDKYWWVEDLFRALLFLLHKEKIRTNQNIGLTPDNKHYVNQLVNTLKLRGIL